MIFLCNSQHPLNCTFKLYLVEVRHDDIITGICQLSFGLSSQICTKDIELLNQHCQCCFGGFSNFFISISSLQSNNNKISIKF